MAWQHAAAPFSPWAARARANASPEPDRKRGSQSEAPVCGRRGRDLSGSGVCVSSSGISNSEDFAYEEISSVGLHGGFSECAGIRLWRGSVGLGKLLGLTRLQRRLVGLARLQRRLVGLAWFQRRLVGLHWGSLSPPRLARLARFQRRLVGLARFQRRLVRFQRRLVRFQRRLVTAPAAATIPPRTPPPPSPQPSRLSRT